jgi:hypothetical protein
MWRKQASLSTQLKRDERQWRRRMQRAGKLLAVPHALVDVRPSRREEAAKMQSRKVQPSNRVG